MKKLFSTILVLGLLWGNVGFAETIYGGPRNIEDAKKLFGNRELDLIEGLWSTYDGSIYAIVKKNDTEYMRWTVDHIKKRFIGKRDTSVKIIKSANPNIYAYHFNMYNPENSSEEALNRSTIIIKNFNLFEYTVPKGCYSEGRCWAGYESLMYRLWPANSTNIVSSEGKKSSGTAFFINNGGNLITNNHVVEGCKITKINYFNKVYDTSLISTDKTLDLALLKVDLEPRDFISFSNKEPKKRQLVIVAGYPLGEYLSDDLKINEGKISSLKGFENNSNEITVDLAINPGNSGGPIVDENGQLVAVAVAGMSKEVTEGISFGIKSSAVTNFLKVNKISPDIKLTSFSMNDEKVNQLLEESTVYIFCEQRKNF